MTKLSCDSRDNGNPPALFKFHHPGAFAVVVTDAVYHGENQKSAIQGKEEDLKTNSRKKVSIPKETSRETTRETSRETILRLIEADATITALTIAELIGITEKGIRYHLNNLKKEGFIKHTGPSKSGKWVFLKKKNDEQQPH